MTAALSSVDGLAILLVLLALGAVFVVVVREVPLLGLCACLAFMCFVPRGSGARSSCS